MLYQGGFLLAIPGGSVMTALSKLEASDMDFSKMHIFLHRENAHLLVIFFSVHFQ
jgi:hypothetical protein